MPFLKTASYEELVKRVTPMLLACCIAFLALQGRAFSQTLSQQNLDSLSAVLNLKYSQVTSPALEQRKSDRKNMQRKGYSNILCDVLMNDGFSALISYIKTKMQIEYSISHRPLSLIVPIERGDGKTWSIPLPDDWSFPIDPWKKE